jgi:hypothetical protein
MKNINYFRELTAEAIQQEAERREALTLDFIENRLAEEMGNAAKAGKDSYTCSKFANPSDVVWSIVVSHLELRGFGVKETDKSVTISW